MSIKKAIPSSIKTALKKVIPTTVIDQLEVMTGERDEMTPPSRLIYTGDGDFKQVGEMTVDRIINMGGLKPTDRVLDVGSGIGRLAIPLTKHLVSPGGYDGIEIVPVGVNWCNQNVSPRYPHFRFHHLDIYNKMYNPEGKIAASDLRFPFESSTFDFVILNSVFTHMLEADFERYLAEIVRVMKTGGRAYITMFLLNEESRRLSGQGKSRYNLVPFTERTMVGEPDVPESTIAYDETYALETIRKAGLQLAQPVAYGNWPGRSNTIDYQDLLFLVKS